MNAGIVALLDVGRSNARTARDLANVIGTDRRTISAAIERERRAGTPICATCDSTAPGYYIAADKADMIAYCDSLRRREREIALTRAACERTIQTLPEGGTPA